MAPEIRYVTPDGVRIAYQAYGDGPLDLARCALAIAEGVRGLDLEIRAGLHTEEVDGSGEKASGLAVVIGARVGALAGPSEVLATSTVKDLVAGSSLAFGEHGEHELKGIRAAGVSTASSPP